MNNDFTLKKEISFVCLMLIIALSLAWVSFSYPSRSSVYPRALSVFLIFLSTCQCIVIYLKNKKNSKEKTQEHEHDKDNGSKAFFSKVSIIIYILSGVYLLGTTMFGFYVSTYLYVAGISLYLGYKNKIVAFVWPIVLCFFVWVVFSWFLHVPTPEGMLF